MNSHRRPVGWRYDSYRHYLSSKGIHTRKTKKGLDMDGAIFRTNGFIKHETKRTVQPESFHDYVKDVVEGARHPMQDADEQWKSDWEAKGKRVRLSNDPIDRSEERSAAIVANVWTQASVEPLVDHGEHNRNVRDQSIDFILGRSRRAERRKMPRETRKQLDKLEI